MMLMQQLTGENSVTYYLPTLITKFIGADRAASLWIGGLTSIVAIFAVWIPIFLVDRFGRRPFLLIGATGMCISFIVVAALLAKAPPGGSHSFGVAIVTFINIFFAFNSSCFLAVPWMYPAEIMPLHLREKGFGVASVIYWLFNFLFVEVTPTALNTIGYKFYVILAILNFGIGVVVYFFYPETKDKSLEQIDFYFATTYGNEAAVQAVQQHHRVELKSTLPADDKVARDSEHVDLAIVNC